MEPKSIQKIGHPLTKLGYILWGTVDIVEPVVHVATPSKLTLPSPPPYPCAVLSDGSAMIDALTYPFNPIRMMVYHVPQFVLLVPTDALLDMGHVLGVLDGSLFEDCPSLCQVLPLGLVLFSLPENLSASGY